MAKKRIYYSEFQQHLESEPLRPVYLFTGAEAFLKEQGIQAIVDKSLPPAARSLNLEIVYALTDVSGREAKERALTLPFLSSYRVLVVRQVEQWRLADLKEILDYLSAPSDHTVLLLISQEERLKTEAWKAIAAQVFHVECYPLFDHQVPGWVEFRTRGYGKRISRSAILLLIERVGQNLTDLDQEINKLTNYVGIQELINEEDVQALVGRIRSDTLQELNNALGQRQASRAIQLAQRLLQEGLLPLQLLGAIAWHFRHLLAARLQYEQGQDPEKLFSTLRNPSARRDMISQLKAYSSQEFKEIFQELLRLDEIAKSSQSHWELALQLALWKICCQKEEAVVIA